MVTLRIQELAEAKGMTLEQLSQDCGISVEKIQLYDSESIEIQQQTAAEIQTIADRLKINSIDLLQATHNFSFIRLNIFEKLKEKSLTLEALSEQSGVHISVVAFYTTQPISQKILDQTKFQEQLEKICEYLECSLEELIMDESHVPVIRYDIDQVITTANLTPQEFSLLTNLSEDCIELLRTEPLTNFHENFQMETRFESLEEIWCVYLNKKVPIIDCEKARQRLRDRQI